MLRFLLFLFLIPAALGAQSFNRWHPQFFLPGDIIEEREGRGLIIRSNPSGARVFIDGIHRGRTPLHLENLIPGRYIVRLEREGYVDRWVRVTVRDGSTTVLTLGLQQAVGRVFLNVQRPEEPPPGKLPLRPRVTVDGTVFHLGLLEIPAGFRTIRVRAFGWEEFSATLLIEQDSFRDLDVNMVPAAFRVSRYSINRTRFFPANAGSLGTTTINFEVSAPGNGTLTVLDSEWNTVYVRSFGPFETWSQSVVWNGRNSRGEMLPDGVYTLVLSALSVPWDNSPAIEDGFVLNVELDSSRVVFPLTIFSGKSGLLFAPLPALLPPGSFQIDGGLFTGSPFAAAFRVSPLERLETAAALNIIPRQGEGEANFGFGGSVKWVFLNPNEGVLGAAAGFAYSWAAQGSITSFGLSPGLELFFPFMLNLGSAFSLVFSPAALWTGDDVFPWDPLPRLVTSAGLLTQLQYLSAGISIRQEYNFNGGQAWLPSTMAGIEVKIFPSNFVFSLMGGIQIIDGSVQNGFGGLGIGMIF